MKKKQVHGFVEVLEGICTMVFYIAFDWNTLKVYKRHKGERPSGRYSNIFSQSPAKHVSQCVPITSYKAAQ